MRKLKVEGNIVDIIKQRIYKGILFIEDGIIVNIEENTHINSDNYILPGFINSHMHVESTMLTPLAFSEIAVKHGTVAVVSDPHEIANVCGTEGIEFMISNSKQSPLKFFFGLPSCVPATSFETSGFCIDAEKTETLFENKDLFFLAEMMNFPGVVYNDKEVISKLNIAKKYNKKIDGHAPGLTGKSLKLYTGAGISTDHECMNIAEAEEKIKLGMKIQIREGSAAKNFEALYPLIDKYPDMIMLCTDDSHPDDLIDGHMNVIVKRAIKKGLDIFNVLKAVSLNVVEHYNLDVGLLQKNHPADFIVTDNLKKLNILKNYINGKLVYDNGKTFINIKTNRNINNFNCKNICTEDIKVENKSEIIKVIEIADGELFTKSIKYKHGKKSKFIESNTDDDVLKIVVLNRYKPSKPSVGFIKNFGLKNGAVASSISHDSHNIIAVGVADKDIVCAINKIIEIKGGIAVCKPESCEYLQLEIAGLMTNTKVNIVSNKYKSLTNSVKDLGSKLNAPFMTLSFMSLLVIPELKISDKGLFDGLKFELTSIYTS